jgi:hypothetical protein
MNKLTEQESVFQEDKGRGICHVVTEVSRV